MLSLITVFAMIPAEIGGCTEGRGHEGCGAGQGATRKAGRG